MKKSFILGAAVSIIITLVLPWLTVTFVNSDGGMAVCLLLFFAVNPFFSVVIGSICRKRHTKSMGAAHYICCIFRGWNMAVF